ncbi:hypothetical protein Tco_0907384 [Tanacetum coccineum]|uniref:Retrovirus-related Pol polyprotein from transposon TNT 1-94 n=1 Tax=Tanacetum coccineum TaxID=301880 RepID=A0ABQ5CK70_9ASTR
MLTRSMAKELGATSAHECLFIDFLSEEEPKKVSEALQHPGWVDAMQDELNQFARNKVWTLVPAPYGKTIIGSKWMDVKSEFLNGKLKEEVYVKQPLGKEIRRISAKSSQENVYSQFPRWRIHLLPYAIKQSERGISINQEKYVKDTLKKYDINGSSVKTPMVPPNNLGPDLSGKAVNETRYRGMIGSLMYLTASRPDIQFLTYLCARYQANPKESHLIVVKRIFRYLKGTLSLGLWYPKCSRFDLKGYSDSDYARCNTEKKSTSCACQLLGGKLVCWSAKKQQSVAMSSAEAECVADVGCCANILWIKSQLTDYDIIYEKVPIFYDNTSAIAISNNLVLHSRTKHIDIRYHFIRDHVLKGDIELHFIPTQYQLADIFTNPLDEPTFKRLIVELALGWLLEEIHVTWAHLEKKQTRLRTYTKSLEDLCIPWLETASQGVVKLLAEVLYDLHIKVFGAAAWGIVRRTIDQSAGGKLRDKNAEESWALLEDLALYDNESWNDPRDFAKPVKAIFLPQDIPSTSDRRLIELENQVQRLMEANLAPTQPT